MTTAKKSTHILVAGSGIIGLTTALAFLKRQYTVTVHTNKANTPWKKNDIDLRVSAISSTSLDIFNQIGELNTLSNYQPFNPYRRISLNTKGKFKFTGEHAISYRSEQAQLDKLGVMVENNAITDDLLRQCKQYPMFNLIIDNQLTFSLNSDQKWQDSKGRIYDLVLACDGANSAWRQKNLFPIKKKSYNTSCMLALIDIDISPQELDHTWQVLCDHGPRALLPLNSKQAILCYYDHNNEIKQLQQLISNLTPDQQLKLITDQLKNKFSFFNQEFNCKKFQFFPLQSLTALQVARNNIILLGDAAHCISPVLGQGVNFGLLDVQRLYQLVDALHDNFDLQQLQDIYNQQSQANYFINAKAYDLIHQLFTQTNKQNYEIALKIMLGLNKINFLNKLSLFMSLGKSPIDSTINSLFQAKKFLSKLF